MITPYDVLREKAQKKERRADGIKEQLLSDPEYFLLESRHREISARYMFCENGEAESLRKQLDEIEQKINIIRKGMRVQSECPVCHGSGIVYGRICDCTLPEIYIRCFGAEDVSSFSESFECSKLSVFDDSERVVGNRTQREAYKVVWNEVKKYADTFPSGKDINLLLQGGTGLGKTFLCRCIAKVVSTKSPVFYVSAPQLARIFLAHRLGEDVELQYLWDASIMIVDDLGAEPLHQNVTIEYLCELIEKRQQKRKHTVFSTNLSVADICSRYGERISSRMSFQELGNRINLYGKDIRHG